MLVWVEHGRVWGWNQAAALGPPQSLWGVWGLWLGVRTAACAGT
jgi:hypothetical protein